MPAPTSFWNRLLRRRRADLVERETERERGSRSERGFATEPFENFQADEFVGEHLGGVSPGWPTGDKRPWR